MKNKFATLTIGLMLASSLTGCIPSDVSIAATSGDSAENTSTVTPIQSTQAIENTTTGDVEVESEIYTQLTEAVDKAANKNYPDEDSYTDTVIFLGANAINSIEIVGEGVTSNENTLTINSGGVYMVTGQFKGQIVINTEDEDVQLKLNNFHIESDADSPISVLSADEVTITAMPGTVNTISDNSPYIEEDETDITRSNGALFSKEDIALNGSGKLTIDSANKSGILGKDDVLILNGNIEIQSTRNGIKGKDLVYISGGVLDITAGTDGIESVTLVYIDGGQTTILDSYEGIEALDIIINDGTVDITASDDGVNISGTLEETEISVANNTTQTFGGRPGHAASLTGHGLYINGGELTVNSSGDGLDSNGNLWMQGGSVVVNGPETDKEGSLDADLTFEVNGGEIIAVGSAGMMRNPDSSSSVNTLSIAFDTTYPAGTNVTLVDSNDTIISEITPAKSFGSFIYTSSQLQLNESYTIQIDGSALDAYELTDTLSTFGTQSARGGRGGGPGGPRDDRKPPVSN